MNITQSILLMVLCIAVILMVIDYIPAKLITLLYVAFTICGWLMFGLISLELSIGVFAIAIFGLYMHK